MADKPPPAAMRAALMRWPLDLAWRERPKAVKSNTIDGMVRRGLLTERRVRLPERLKLRGKLAEFAVRIAPTRRLYRLTCAGLAEIARLRPEVRLRADLLQFDLVLAELDEGKA